MALTPLQRDVCRLLASLRRSRGESYVAGGVALGEALRTTRISRDLDLFHDTREAVTASWNEDRRLLEHQGLAVAPLHERPGFVEAQVSRGTETLVIEWAQDSAFRFFPLVEDDQLGLTLHPFDLATNKVLALVGRVEARDWVDVIACDARLQPLGYLAWAACGKDPGFTPPGLLGHARRTARYSSVEIAALAFEGPPPEASALGQRWQQILAEADAVSALLPADHLGEAVLDDSGDLLRSGREFLRQRLTERKVRFHAGRIGGAVPTLK